MRKGRQERSEKRKKGNNKQGKERKKERCRGAEIL